MIITYVVTYVRNSQAAISNHFFYKLSTANFDQLIYYRVQSCCNKYIYSVCIKFVNTLPWAMPSVDVYKSDTDLMYVLQSLLTYSQACTI